MSPKDPHFHNEAKELNLSCENEFYLHENEKAFPYQRLSTEPRFDTEVWGNSEIAYWLLFWCQVSSLSHRNYKCFCPKRCFFSPDRLQGRVEQAIKSSHRFVETLCCYFGIFPLQGNLAVKRCNILTMLLSPSKSATNKHLSILLLVHLFPKILTPKVLIDPLALQVMRNPHWIFSFSSQNLCLYIRNAHFNGINFERKNNNKKKHCLGETRGRVCLFSQNETTTLVMRNSSSFISLLLAVRTCTVVIASKVPMITSTHIIVLRSSSSFSAV